MSPIRTTGEFGSLPIRSRERVELAHGGGGALMREIITQVFTAGFADRSLDTERDAAVTDFPEDGRMALSTDSFVVKPLFFPGGNIGVMAINSTINDLAMVGARPLYMTVGFILEEGLELVDLDKIVASMRQAAQASEVRLVTGDTKVVDRGSGDGVFINTTGVGVVAKELDIGPRRVKPGDAVLLSGDIGRHGIAVLSVRQELGFQTQVQSDTAPLVDIVHALLADGIDIHCMRDLTRGGLAAALIDIARIAACDIDIAEGRISIDPEVAAACEIIGLDPMYVANEGRMVVFVAEEDADRAVEIMRKFKPSRGTRQIGSVADTGRRVRLRTSLGTHRILDRLNGEKMPRVC